MQDRALLPEYRWSECGARSVRSTGETPAHMPKFLQRAVSKKKRRFVDAEFDIDLSYVSDRIIVMGFPSCGSEVHYRNPMPDTQQFLESRHAGHYKVFNFCAEPSRQYDPAKFHDRVSRYPFFDHNCPPLEMVKACCEDAADWLQQDAQNVVAFHCKAGKGRAGMMTVCLLMHIQAKATIEEALEFYAVMRTSDGHGVTIPSQIRYATYYSRLLGGEGETMWPRLMERRTLRSIVLAPVPTLKGNPKLWYRVTNGDIVWSYKEWMGGEAAEATGGAPSLELDGNCLQLEGDVKIQIFKQGRRKSKEICQVWFNTGFAQGGRLVFGKPGVDKAYSDKKCKKFTDDFSITVSFFDAERARLPAR